MIKYLLGKAGTGKFRFYVVESDEEWHEDKKGFIIQRSYGQVNGKTTLSPEIIVGKKPEKKTWRQQLELKYNSEVKKVLDKGYVEVDKHPNEYDESELAEIFGEVATNQYGCIKPMLAKQESKVTKRSIFDKYWLGSFKLDGVRSLMPWDGKEAHAFSRGGEHYDNATEHIRKYPPLVKFFEEHPTIILDGELYKHGKTLQQISGAARLEKNAYDCEWLEYWIYDMYDTANPDMTAEERYNFLFKHIEPIAHQVLLTVDKKLHIGEAKDSPLYLLDAEGITDGEKGIWDYHDAAVELGFEGCVIRDPARPYKPNGRTNDMIKFKNYKSEDFLVVGYELGTRGSEDMTFICELPDGRTFKAMPVGDRSVKEEYVDNFEDKYEGHMAECTYFNYSDEGIPTQPKLRTFRFDLE